LLLLTFSFSRHLLIKFAVKIVTTKDFELVQVFLVAIEFGDECRAFTSSFRCLILETSLLSFCLVDVFGLCGNLGFALVDRRLVESKRIVFGLAEELLGAFSLDFLN
jgi:hypothetical protein